MKVRSEVWGWGLLASLGLIPVACGGSAEGAATDADGEREKTRERRCESPQLDDASGIERCGIEEIYYHRAAVGPGCQFTAPRASGDAEPADEGYGGAAACNPADCPGEYPYCDRDEPELPETCQKGCRVDADCGANQICSCSGSEAPGTCVAADCRTDADCGTGELCASTFAICGPMEFHCTKPHDVCLSGADCEGGICAWGTPDDEDAGAQAPGRYCDYGICGRPFLVDEQARLAGTAPRGDWRDGALPQVALEDLTWTERQALKQHYANAARMEHASIAAFARFSLQLLSLGAPAELVESCTRAIADETAHARVCFELASRYGGAAVGPTALPLDGCLDVSSLDEIVELTIAEGCVGETLAALEAAEAAEQASDATVRAALLRIAADERNHAELAFRFVRWAVTSHPRLLARVEAAFAAHVRRASSAAELAETTPRLLAHGLLSSAQKAELRGAALKNVVAPCAKALLASSAARPLRASAAASQPTQPGGV